MRILPGLVLARPGLAAAVARPAACLATIYCLGRIALQHMCLFLNISLLAHTPAPLPLLAGAGHAGGCTAPEDENVEAGDEGIDAGVDAPAA